MSTMPYCKFIIGPILSGAELLFEFFREKENTFAFVVRGDPSRSLSEIDSFILDGLEKIRISAHACFYSPCVCN